MTLNMAGAYLSSNWNTKMVIRNIIQIFHNSVTGFVQEHKGPSGSISNQKERGSVSQTRWLLTLRQDRNGWRKLFSAVLLPDTAPETDLVLVMKEVLLLVSKKFYF